MFKIRALLLTFAVLCGNTPAWADLALAQRNNCLNCHTVERKLLGPAFRDVANRYRGHKDAADLLARKIVSGGKGAWGVLAMPANPKISEADARALATWVLTLQ